MYSPVPIAHLPCRVIDALGVSSNSIAALGVVAISNRDGKITAICVSPEQYQRFCRALRTLDAYDPFERMTIRLAALNAPDARQRLNNLLNGNSAWTVAPRAGVSDD